MERLAGIVLCVCFALTACRREQRDLRASSGDRVLTETAARESDLQPGGALPPKQVSNPYNGNANAITEGQRLFTWYNCSGCHANGGEESGHR